MKRSIVFLALALGLAGCPGEDADEEREDRSDAAAEEGGGEGGAAEGGEGGQPGGEGAGGDGGEAEGPGGEGGEGECEAGSARECETDCLRGEQTCREGAWGECRGRVRCDVRGCAERHPDACEAPAACDHGAARECESDCIARGEQICRDGAWSPCRGRVRCDAARCAERHPDACAAPPVCEDGQREECVDACVAGARMCRDGEWGRCMGDRVRCDVPECAREFPDRCPAPGCEPGAARECETPCVPRGEQVCDEEGRWTRCRGEVNCENERCAKERPDACEAPPACARGDRRACETDCVPRGVQECDGGEWTRCMGEIACDRPVCAREFPERCEPPPACEGDRRRECVDGCWVGFQVCREGQWSECDRVEPRCGVAECARELPDRCEPPAECREGGEQRCVTECVEGAQRCVEGQWGRCEGEIRCAREVCAREFPDRCEQPAECRGDQRRECVDGCWAGVQVCREGQWTVCDGIAPRCEIAECAREFPDRCEQPPECRGDAERRCETECVVGGQRCVEGQWGACEGEVRCERRVCAREFPDRCEQPAECRAGAERRCETECVVGGQRCVEGQWGACEGEVRCAREVCAREFPEQCVR